MDEKKVEQLVKFLEERQFSGDRDEHGCAQCTECYEWDWRGHKAACKLALLLQEFGVSVRFQEAK